MEELPESHKEGNKDEVNLNCLIEGATAVADTVSPGGQNPLTEITQPTCANIEFNTSQSTEDVAQLGIVHDFGTQRKEQINQNTADRNLESSEKQVEENKDEIYIHYVTDKFAVFLAGTDEENNLDAISQQTGADLQFDPKPSVEEDTNIIFIRSSQHQIDEALWLINQMTITEQRNSWGLYASEIENPSQNPTEGHTEEISLDLESQQAAFLVDNMWLTDAIKEQEGINIQFNACIRGSQPQIAKALRLVCVNMDTQTSDRIRYMNDCNESAESQTEENTKEVLPSVTDEKTGFLSGTDEQNSLTAITQQTGGDVLFESKPSVEEDLNHDFIRGFPSQLKMAVSLVDQKADTQKENLLVDPQNFWLQWVEAAFPNLDSRTYFVPPVYVNRVPMTRQSIAGQDVLVLSADFGQSNQCPRVQDSDIRDDAAMQRVLCCLQKMFEKNGEVLVGLSQLQFGQYLGEPCYSAAAAQLPLPANLPSAVPQNWKRGEFDVLLIHREYGLVILEVKSVGHKLKKLSVSQQELDNIVRKKLKQAISQLNKAEVVLSHLVSDISPGLRVSKTIVVPNLTSHQLLQAISDDPRLSQDLSQCLGTRHPADISGLCLCSDHLSDFKTPWDVGSKALMELENWWRRCVAGAGPDSHMGIDVYKTLVARFCGPATTVTVPCTSPSRVCIKTMDQAVSLTAQCYTALITLFPEQVNLLNAAPSRLFLAGPPGTGKTVVLLLMALEWWLRDHKVCILSTWFGSHAVSSMLYYLLKKIEDVEKTSRMLSGTFFLKGYDFADRREDVNSAITDLSLEADKGSLYVIADEAGSEYSGNKFRTFCNELSRNVPELHLWAASCYHGDAPVGWQVEYLTRPLRSPPVVVREVEQDGIIREWHEVHRYVERGVPDHTEGPPIKRLYHQGEGHSSRWPADCVYCGHQVASLLYSLRVGATDNASATSTTVTSSSGGTTPPRLQWRDVLVLHSGDYTEELGIVTGLRQMSVPVKEFNNSCDDDDLEDLATAKSDVVWVANRLRVRGMEKKIVICLKQVSGLADRLHCMSRCTSQLVIVSR